VMKVAQRIAKAGMKAFNADGVTLLQFSEPAGGQVVFHLHVHVIPRRDKIELRPPESYKAPASELAEQASKLSAAI
jgi:histidine triad (HIT) family protein